MCTLSGKKCTLPENPLPFLNEYIIKIKQGNKKKNQRDAYENYITED